MKTTWKYRLFSGFCVLVIAGTSTAGVLAADQSRNRRIILQENLLQETSENTATFAQSEDASENTAVSAQSEETLENIPIPAQSEETLENVPIPAQSKETLENIPVSAQSEEAAKEGEAAKENTNAAETAEKSSSAEDASAEVTAMETTDAGMTESKESSSEAGQQETQPTTAGKKKTRNKQPLPATEEEIDAYFDGTVLVGDSVMLGFRNYSMRRANTFLGRIQFLASGSFSVHNALWPINSKSVHPIFQGQQRFVWDSLGMIQPKRVFLFFGLNDMNMGSLADTCAKYSQVIANIKTTCPDAEIHLMSMTYTLRGKGKGNLNNPTIRQFNELLKQMARDNGWGFVDIANPLSDANGDLAPAYCSDNYVHQTNAAYDVWAVVLRDYARSQLERTSEFTVGEDDSYTKIDGEGSGEILEIDGKERGREEINQNKQK